MIFDERFLTFSEKNYGGGVFRISGLYCDPEGREASDWFYCSGDPQEKRIVRDSIVRSIKRILITQSGPLENIEEVSDPEYDRYDQEE